MIAMKYSRYIKIQNDYAQRQCVWCDVYVWKKKKNACDTRHRSTRIMLDMQFAAGE